VYHHTQPDYFINDKNVFHLDLGKDGTGVWTQGLVVARQCPTIWATPQALFWSYFSSRVSHFCPRPASNHDPPTYSLPDMLPHLACLLMWDLANFYAGADLEPWSSHLYLH
jgi:hypothetical protein